MARSARPIWQTGMVPPGFWAQSANRRAYMEWLEKKLRIREPEDWYQVTHKTLSWLGSTGILYWYDRSIRVMIQDYVPWYDFKEWLFTMAPRGFWNQPENRRRYLEWLADRLGFKEPEDWYLLSGKDLLGNNGSTLLNRHGGSPRRVVMENFPEYPWCEWLFWPAPKGFWDQPKNRRRYLEWLGRLHSCEKPEDWYGRTRADFTTTGGSSLLRRFGHSFYGVLKWYYPDFEWKEWLFQSAPVGFWNKLENRLRYLEWLGEELGFKEIEDWYGLMVRDLLEHRGSTLATRFNNVPAAIVMTHFPDHPWEEWRFVHTPTGFWSKRKNRRRYLEWLGKKLGFERPEDWYRIRSRDITENHGGGLLHSFRGSPSALVIDTMPEYDWEVWLFDGVPFRFWYDPKNQKRYLKWLGKKLGVEKTIDWSRVPMQAFIDNHGGGLVCRFSGSVIAILKSQWPRYDWKTLRRRSLAGHPFRKG